MVKCEAICRVQDEYAKKVNRNLVPKSTLYMLELSREDNYQSRTLRPYYVNNVNCTAKRSIRYGITVACIVLPNFIKES